MRFILNFIFFGVLFYAIYLAFPDVFYTLVGWANKIYEFIRDLYYQLSDRIQEWKMKREGSQSPPPQHAIFLLPLWVMMKVKEMSGK